MPLKNRLEEVIRRYERASQLVKGYKEGTLSEEELGRSFKQLRKDRKAVDLHNRRFLIQERRRHSREEEVVDDNDINNNNDITNDNNNNELQQQQESSEEEEEDHDVEPTGSNEADDETRDTDATMTHSIQQESESSTHTTTRPRMSRRKEEKLWKQYGSFWRNV